MNGAGLVGMLTIQLAKAAGCRVIAVDLDLQRVEQARQFGADLALCSADPDTPSRVKAIRARPSSLKTQQFENLDDQEFGIATRTRFE